MPTNETEAVAANVDALCAKGNAHVADAPRGGWICDGCGRHFAKSPNQHIYAARKRVRASKETPRVADESRAGVVDDVNALMKRASKEG